MTPFHTFLGYYIWAAGSVFLVYMAYAFGRLRYANPERRPRGFAEWCGEIFLMIAYLALAGIVVTVTAPFFFLVGAVITPLLAVIWLTPSLRRKFQNKMEKASLPAQPEPRPKRGTGLAGWVAFFILLSLLVVAFGNIAVIQVTLTVLFGWAVFLFNNAQQITLNWEMIGLGIAGLALLSLGGHFFLKWLFRSRRAATSSTDAPRTWKARWTAGLVTALFILFASGLGFIGASRNAGWLVDSDNRVFTSSWTRRFDAGAKTNLHNFYLACQAYWAESRPDNNCTLDIVTRPEYGFVASKDGAVQGGGTKNDFHAVSHTVRGKKWFFVDPQGTIKELASATLPSR